MTGFPKQSISRKGELEFFVATLLAMTVVTSALLGRDIPKLRRMLNYIVETVGQMYPLVRWRALLDRQSRPPFLRRADRPRDKTTAAVRAHIVQLVLDAVRAERAFVRADARFHRSWRKILVAILAVRPELQRHGLIREFLVATRSVPPLPQGERERAAVAGTSSYSIYRKSRTGYECRISLDFGHLPQNYRCNSLSGSLELSFNRSSTIDERTCATLWCGISTLLTISDRLFRSRNTTFSK